jgi:hypothetical protein
MAKLVWTHKGDTYCAECSVDMSNVVFTNTPLKPSFSCVSLDQPNIDFTRINRAVKLSNDSGIPFQVILRWFNMVDDEFIIGLAARSYARGDQMRAESIICRGQSPV